ncbi:MAG: helix-turn-helix domain-containing protein [Nitrospira sp.]|nr:helix-turn-helix domain-containing protein [Nitrospira sp.]
MSKAGKQIIKGAQDALAALQGKAPGRAHMIRASEIDVREIREHLNMTQADFSETFGIPVPTLKKWEAGKRVPEGPAKAYLIVINKNPSAVKRALRSL